LINPQSPDTDGDGLPDSVENYYGLNRFNASDANADLDTDDLPNWWEYQQSFNLDDSFTGMEDSDFDTLDNLSEYLHGTDPWLADSDNDGFDDAEEIAAGSHPRHSGSTPITPGNYGTGSSIIDTDGDGIPDDQDAYPTDPTNTPDPSTGPHNPYTPLQPPANLLAMATAIDTVRLDWTPTISSRPTSIETSTNGVTWTLQEVVPAGVTHLIIPDLNPDQRVYFRARTGDVGGGGSGAGAAVTPPGSLMEFIVKAGRKITDYLYGPSMQVAHTPPPPPFSPPSPHRDLIPRDDYTTPSWLHLQTRFKAIGYNEWLDTDPATGNSYGACLNYTLSNHLGTTEVLADIMVFGAAALPTDSEREDLLVNAMVNGSGGQTLDAPSYPGFSALQAWGNGNGTGYDTSPIHPLSFPQVDAQGWRTHAGISSSMGANCSTETIQSQDSTSKELVSAMWQQVRFKSDRAIPEAVTRNYLVIKTVQGTPPLLPVQTVLGNATLGLPASIANPVPQIPLGTATFSSSGTATGEVEVVAMPDGSQALALEPQLQQGFNVSISLIPVELLTDLNNDGKIDSADGALRDKALKQGASDEDKEKGTEYTFVNDKQSNGAWDAEDEGAFSFAYPSEGKLPKPPTDHKDDDDVEELKITLNANFGALWFEHLFIEDIGFYRTRECKEADKIDIKPDAPYNLAENEPLPSSIFMRVESTYV
jgi:hypothetical protein